MNDNLADIKNKLIELEDRLRSNNIRIDETSEEAWETWEECERKVQWLFSEELDVKDVVIEYARAHRAQAYSPENKNSKKLRPMTVVYKLLSCVDKARTLKNIHRLKGASYYTNKEFSKETLAYQKEWWEIVKAWRKEGKVAYLNIVIRERIYPQI